MKTRYRSRSTRPSRSSAAIFSTELHDSRTVLLDGCGHMPMMAKPGEVASALDAFLRAPIAPGAPDPLRQAAGGAPRRMFLTRPDLN